MTQVHCSEEQLESTIEELTRLEMAAHGFTEVLSKSAAEQSARSGAGASSSEESASASQQSAASAVQQLSSVQQLERQRDDEAEGAVGVRQRHEAQQQRPRPPDKQRHALRPCDFSNHSSTLRAPASPGSGSSLLQCSSSQLGWMLRELSIELMRGCLKF